MDDLFYSIKDSVDKNKRYVLISDENIFALYGQSVMSCFNYCEYILVPASEQCKTRLVKQSVEDQLFALGICRSDALVALGGGALIDLVGFVASTYMRGIDYYTIPTTLLAMVDACIGGKCAVNHPAGKNLLGSFYPSKRVFTSTYFLKSLKKEQISDAMAEVVKYAVIADVSLFDRLDGDLQTLINECQAIKNRIVSQDARDNSIRNCLNFGHTIGHAVELLSEFNLSHGQAVSIGLCVELELCNRICALPKKSVVFVKNVLNSYSLPISIEGFSKSKIVDQCFFDKKAQDLPRFVLTNQLGTSLPFDGSYLKKIDRREIFEALCEC